MKILSKLKTRSKLLLAGIFATASIVVLLPILLHKSPELPPGTNLTTSPTGIAAENIRLLIDDTAWDTEKSRRVIDQEIFDEIMAMVDRADQFVYVDLFLWNSWQGSIPEEHRQLSQELARALIKKKRSVKKLDVIVLSDPINRIYGGHEPDFFKDMAKVGIPVVFTDLSELPDSNTIYAPYWSIVEKFLNTPLLAQWSGHPRFSNPFDRGGDKISALQWGRMLMFKANHRKVVIAGSIQHGLEMVVGSLNPADGSSAHSNAALMIKGQPVLEALQTELTALRWSIKRKQNVIVGATSMAAFKADSIERKAGKVSSSSDTSPDGSPDIPTVQWLTEGTIAEAVIDLLGEAGPGNEVRVAIFYLSERRVIDALKGAIIRGASVRIVMDANRDAFGMRKIGVPNRPVAAELMKLSRDHDVDIRWADTTANSSTQKPCPSLLVETGNRYS